MARFSYQPLRSSRSIRLIKFLPGPEPKCQMITVEVEKAPPYVALSYTWGSKVLARTIEVSGCEMPITVNLAEAIEAMYSFVRGLSMMFWADSICINQEDTPERGKQVQIMNTIYRSAEHVAIWLGPEAEESHLALHLIRQWKADIDELKPKCNGVQSLAISEFFAKNPSYFGPHGSQQRGLEALRALCRRRWWRRAWIVQEASNVNSSRLILFCGGHRIEWQALGVVLVIHDHYSEFQRFGNNVGLEDRMASFLNQFRHKRQSGAYVRLLDVLLHLQTYESEDPRDKVYAALGMAMDLTENDIIPNYTKSVTDVYKDVVNFYLSKSNNHSLDVLSAILSRPSRTMSDRPDSILLPSWVPDWSFRTSICPFEKRPDSYQYEQDKSMYNACDSLTGSGYIDGDRLHLKGSVVDKITRLWKTGGRSFAGGEFEIEQSWTPTNPTDRYFTGETIMTAFNRTIVADARIEQVSSRGFAMDWNLVRRDRSTMTTSESVKRDWMVYATKRTTTGRRLFQTQRGFIGIGPAAANMHDQVCVLLGGQVLYVLRNSSVHSDHHQFVGECYVHGMMDGQAVQDEAYLCRDFILE